MCNVWGFHSSVAEGTSVGLLGTTCPVTQHHILEDLRLEISMFLLQIFRQIALYVADCLRRFHRTWLNLT
jgi:hypothetical protein